MSKGNPRIVLRIDQKSLSELKQQANGQGITVSELIRDIIYAYLELHS